MVQDSETSSLPRHRATLSGTSIASYLSTAILRVQAAIFCLVLVASGIVLGYLLHRQASEQQGQQLALYSSTIAPAISLQDPIQAAEISQAFSANANIQAAWAFDAKGRLYGQPSQTGTAIRKGTILLNGQALGVAFVAFSPPDLTPLILGIILLLTLLILASAVHYFVVSKTTRTVLVPLENLADWASAIPADSLPGAPPVGGDLKESAQLGNGFDRIILSLKAALIEQRTARRDVEIANHAKNEFLAQVSHELRTPMNGIMGTTDLLQSSSMTPEQLELLQTLQSSGHLLMGILNDMLDIASINNNSLSLNPDHVDLLDLLTGAANNIRPAATAKGLAVNFPAPPDKPVRVLVDGQRLRQVVQNLLSNAVKFTQSGSIDLKVDLTPAGRDYLQMDLYIKDTGIGIAESKIERIFDPFFQADLSFRRKQGGIGLGLPISRQIIRKMGGEIEVSSRPGEGSTFSIHLSLARVPELSTTEVTSPAGKPTPHAQVDKSLQVLIAEDNKVNQRVLAMMLKRSGITPAVVDNGRAAVDYLQSSPVDVILMDLQMPVMDGLEATKTIRSTLPSKIQPYIIAVTAHALPADVQQCEQAGMQGHISKPVKAEELLRYLTTIDVISWRNSLP